jgi:hypothetical protein
MTATLSKYSRLAMASLLGVALALATLPIPASAQNAAQCDAYARNYAYSRSGGSGIFGGALFGGLMGGIIGKGTGALIGAGMGAIVGGSSMAHKKNKRYAKAFDACMSGTRP